MRVFISHSSAQHREARLLKEQLEVRGFDVFVASDSLRAGDAWRLLIKQAVRRCEVVVVIDSPEARDSAWVQQEAGVVLATGAIVIPVSVHSSPSGLPGWLADFQAVTWNSELESDAGAERIADAIVGRAELQAAQLPEELRSPRTVGAFVLRVLRQDQFLAPAERRGAWSRQYDRYLALYYGSEPPPTVSQGTTLTFTGMNVARLRTFLSGPIETHRNLATTMLENTTGYVLASRDPDEGGFGRRVEALKAQGGRGLELDLRHTCWALSALLDLNPDRFRREITIGYEWLLQRWERAFEKDRWCWTYTAVARTLLDPRCPVPAFSIRPGVDAAIAALEAAWDPRHGAWVSQEPIEERSRASIDNALHVLECVTPFRSVSPKLERQCSEAVDRLLDRCLPAEGGSRGLPLFDSSGPEAGPTAQLVRIVKQMSPTDTSRLEDFVVWALSSSGALPLTFSWHLSAALTVPELVLREI